MDILIILSIKLIKKIKIILFWILLYSRNRTQIIRQLIHSLSNKETAFKFLILHRWTAGTQKKNVDILLFDNGKYSKMELIISTLNTMIFWILRFLDFDNRIFHRYYFIIINSSTIISFVYFKYFCSVTFLPEYESILTCIEEFPTWYIIYRRLSMETRSEKKNFALDSYRVDKGLKLNMCIWRENKKKKKKRKKYLCIRDTYRHI